MVFSSPEFLFAFLPATVLLYFVVPKRLRNALLLAASLLFYAWGGGHLLLLLLASIASNYALGLLVERSVERRGWRTFCVAASAVVTLVAEPGPEHRLLEQLVKVVA